MYLCKVSFLTTLDIYKDYFKGLHKAMHKIIHADSGLVHYSLCRSYCIFTPGALWPRSFLIFIVDELKNFATNNLLQVDGVSHVQECMHHWLVTYWDSCIEPRDYRYNTSPIGYWVKGSNISWYFGIGQMFW